VPHTATAKDKRWDTGALKPGQSAERKVTKGMSAAYFCSFHPAMTAPLNVI
jgi:plastocyanin